MSSPILNALVPTKSLCSPWCYVEISSYHCDATFDCGEGRSAVETATIASRQAFQELHRGHAIHCQERRPAGLVQGHCTADHQGFDCARSLNDDKRTVSSMLI